VSWQDPQAHLGAGLPPPVDGITVSSHEIGPVGERWEALIRKAKPEAQDRMLRGRTYAKRGRVRALHVSPGVATAEVIAKESYNPSLRVRPFERQEWSQLTRALLKDLDTIASLLDGDLPAPFLSKLEKKGVALLPTFAELSFDCDCGDYIMPCAHVATVFHVLTHALDGDPFLLLTLRGRTRDQLMATLRSGWGDEVPILAVESAFDEAPPEGDWFASPSEIPDFACSVGKKVLPAAGLRAIGPPPGEADLMLALTPLYERGGAAALDLIASVPDRVPPKRRVVRAPVRAPVAPVEAEVAPAPAPAPVPVAPPPVVAAPVEPAPPAPSRAPSKKAAAPPRSAPAPAPARPAAPADITEALVNLLAETNDPTSTGIARALGVTVSEVRRELLELEELGLVYQDRTGEKPVWRLG
jgi:uncharacterized Zn finger protein